MSDENAISTMWDYYQTRRSFCDTLYICTIEYYILRYSYHDKINHRFVKYDLCAGSLACKIRKKCCLESIFTH